MNQVTLQGRMGRDPEFTETASGAIMARLEVATNARGKTDWHRVVLWDKAAEIARYLKRGDPVFIQGRLQSRRVGERLDTEIVGWTIFPLKGRDETVADDDLEDDHDRD